MNQLSSGSPRQGSPRSFCCVPETKANHVPGQKNSAHRQIARPFDAEEIISGRFVRAETENFGKHPVFLLTLTENLQDGRCHGKGNKRPSEPGLFSNAGTNLSPVTSVRSICQVWSRPDGERCCKSDVPLESGLAWKFTRPLPHRKQG